MDGQINCFHRQAAVVNMATLGPNQSEREKDNRGIVLEGHVTH